MLTQSCDENCRLAISSLTTLTKFNTVLHVWPGECIGTSRAWHIMQLGRSPCSSFNFLSPATNDVLIYCATSIDSAHTFVNISNILCFHKDEHYHISPFVTQVCNCTILTGAAISIVPMQCISCTQSAHTIFKLCKISCSYFCALLLDIPLQVKCSSQLEVADFAVNLKLLTSAYSFSTNNTDTGMRLVCP